MTPVVMEEKKRPQSPPVELQSKKQNLGPDPVALPDRPNRPKQPKKPKVVRRKYKVKEVDATSPLGVLQHEIQEILRQHGLTEEDVANDMKTLLNDKTMEEKYHRVVENVEVLQLSSNGDGIALIPHPDSKNQICIVPFGLPGDICTIKVFKSHPLYVESDLLTVVNPSKERDDSLINCKYFGKCSGCQYQNVDYEQQLTFKRQTIENAYKFFATNIKEQLPVVSDTQPSPLQYSYRTKLTPHFNLPYSKHGSKLEYAPQLGFGAKGRPTWRETAGGSSSILDIEECSIGTEIINKGMDNERKRFATDYVKYKKGATILLREDTYVANVGDDVELKPASTDASGTVSTVEIAADSKKLVKTCVTQSRQIVTEYVNGYTFEFSAGEFFQNNNSILPAVTDYVRSNLAIAGSAPGEPNYLVDAYCGSGLFSITCSQNVSKVIGVEVSADSVKFAERNAKTNNIENAQFIVGKAEQIFGSIDSPPDRTSVILDPPRKGCDDVFLNQLSTYHPAKIVYISCNVHSQARDIDWFITKTEHGKDYEVESIKGFDFFPQTHHVESVAVLKIKGSN